MCPETQASDPCLVGPPNPRSQPAGRQHLGDTGLCVTRHITAGPSLPQGTLRAPLGAGKGHPLAHVPLPSSLMLGVTCALCGLTPNVGGGRCCHNLSPSAPLILVMQTFRIFIQSPKQLLDNRNILAEHTAGSCASPACHLCPLGLYEHDREPLLTTSPLKPATPALCLMSSLCPFSTTLVSHGGGVFRWETFLSLTKASLAGKSSHFCMSNISLEITAQGGMCPAYHLPTSSSPQTWPGWPGSQE